MRKAALVLAACLCMAAILTGCSDKADAPAIRAGEIGPMPLTADQQEIVDLIAYDKQEIELFSFDSKDAYTSFELWVEVYEYGELTEPKLAQVHLSNDTPRVMTGKIVMLLRPESDACQFTFIYEDEGGTRAISPSKTYAYNTGGMGRGYGAIREPAKIVADEAILLYTSFYSDGGIRVFSVEDVASDPSLLAEYPLAYVLRCRFNTQAASL